VILRYAKIDFIIVLNRYAAPFSRKRPMPVLDGTLFNIAFNPDGFASG
jgi:hypothetical protein